MKTARILAFLLVLLWTSATFAALTDNQNGTITDSTSTLMWTKPIDCNLDWNVATARASALTYATFSDWRLPTRDELLALVDPLYAPQINPIFDPGINPARWSFWSSTVIQVSHAIDEYQAYVVFYGEGNYFTAPKLGHYCVRYTRFAGLGNVTLHGSDVTINGVYATW